jgi:ACR3 family arsenite efflux pump ArsB
VGSHEPTGTLDGSWGTAMTWKDEVLLFWIFCAVVIAFAARHLLGEAFHMVEQMAAFSFAYVPGLVHLLIGHLR